MVRTAVIGFLLLASCDDSSDKRMSEIEEIMRANARDPDSVQFRNMNFSDTGRTQWVCGEMNGANAMGGMTGFRRFIIAADGSLFRWEDEPDYQAIAEFCPAKD